MWETARDTDLATLEQEQTMSTTSTTTDSVVSAATSSLNLSLY